MFKIHQFEISAQCPLAYSVSKKCSPDVICCIFAKNWQSIAEFNTTTLPQQQRLLRPLPITTKPTPSLPRTASLVFVSLRRIHSLQLVRHYPAGNRVCEKLKR